MKFLIATFALGLLTTTGFANYKGPLTACGLEHESLTLKLNFKVDVAAGDIHFPTDFIFNNGEIVNGDKVNKFIDTYCSLRIISKLGPSDFSLTDHFGRSGWTTIPAGTEMVLTEGQTRQSEGCSTSLRFDADTSYALLNCHVGSAKRFFTKDLTLSKIQFNLGRHIKIKIKG